MCEGLEFLAVERGVDSRGCTRVRVTRKTTDAEALRFRGMALPLAPRQPARAGQECVLSKSTAQRHSRRCLAASAGGVSRDEQRLTAAARCLLMVSPPRATRAARRRSAALARARVLPRERAWGRPGRARERVRVLSFRWGSGGVCAWRLDSEVCGCARFGWGGGSCTVKDDDQRRDGDESAGGRQQQIDVLAARLSEQRLREGGGRGSVQR